MHLHPAATAAGIRLVEHEVVGSTNVEALALAREGERGPLWLVAHTQSAGRGRRGRNWVSQPGNLFATLLLTDLEQSSTIAQLSFVAGLAVYDAVAELAPQLAIRLSLKWPNDVLFDGKKVCGILLEGETRPDSGTIVAIGIGVNCGHHPSDAEFPATDLSAVGVKIAPDILFLGLSQTMLTRLLQWKGGAGFVDVRSDWLAHAEGRGRSVRVRLHNRELTGLFEALDERGYLIVRLPDGSSEAIAAGDVFPLMSSSAGHA